MECLSVGPLRSLSLTGFSGRPSEPGKYSSAMGGFITGIDQYDPLEFGISMKEAQNMDPSARLILEVAHQVGICPFSFASLNLFCCPRPLSTLAWITRVPRPESTLHSFCCLPVKWATLIAMKTTATAVSENAFPFVLIGYRSYSTYADLP